MPQYNTALPTQGGYVARDTVARIAQRRAEKARQDREAQVRLQQEADKAIENAQKLMDNDFSDLNKNVVGAAWKVFDAYKDDYYDAITALDANPSAQNRKRLNDVVMNYQSIINDIKSTGAMMTDISSKEWDTTLSLEGINSMSDFIDNIGGYIKKLDGHTGTVDGQKISKLFMNTVKLDKFINPVDVKSSIDRFKQLSLGKEQSTEYIVGNKKYTKSWRPYNEKESRASFASDFSDQQRLKLSMQVINDFKNDEDGALGLDKYISYKEDGSMYVNNSDLYDYLYDNYLVPEMKATSKETAYNQKDDMTAGEEQRMGDRNAMINNISSFYGGDPSVQRTFATDETQIIGGQWARAEDAKLISLPDGKFGYELIGKTTDGKRVTEKFDISTREGVNRLITAMTGASKIGQGDREIIINKVLEKNISPAAPQSSYDYIIDDVFYVNAQTEAPKSTGNKEVEAVIKSIKALGVPVKRSKTLIGIKKDAIIIGDMEDAIDLNDANTPEGLKDIRDKVSAALYNYESNKNIKESPSETDKNAKQITIGGKIMTYQEWFDYTKTNFPNKTDEEIRDRLDKFINE